MKYCYHKFHFHDKIKTNYQPRHNRSQPIIFLVLHYIPSVNQSSLNCPSTPHKSMNFSQNNASRTGNKATQTTHHQALTRGHIRMPRVYNLRFPLISPVEHSVVTVNAIDGHCLLAFRAKNSRGCSWFTRPVSSRAWYSSSLLFSRVLFECLPFAATSARLRWCAYVGRADCFAMLLDGSGLVQLALIGRNSRRNVIATEQ